MENEEITIANELKASFNDGYLLGKYRFEAAKELEAGYSNNHNNNTDTSIQMLIKGINEGVKEIEKQHQKNLDEIQAAREESQQEKDLLPDI